VEPWLVADLIVAAHVLWVAVVVLAVPLIVAGGLLHWRWVRRLWLRVTHLVMIGIVVGESLLGVACPLTVWEQEARRAAGETGYTGSFIGHWLHELLFFDFPPWVFTTAYVAFGMVVVALWIWVRPERRL
jgi:hypothetical protein